MFLRLIFQIYPKPKSIEHKGLLNYPIDPNLYTIATLSVCGDFGTVISYDSINPNAKVKVAVIDTGSDLANEKYSVIGDEEEVISIVRNAFFDAHVYSHTTVEADLELLRKRFSYWKKKT